MEKQKAETNPEARPETWKGELVEATLESAASVTGFPVEKLATKPTIHNGDRIRGHPIISIRRVMAATLREGRLEYEDISEALGVAPENVQAEIHDGHEAVRSRGYGALYAEIRAQVAAKTGITLPDTLTRL